jgi:hypothetical protein
LPFKYFGPCTVLERIGVVACKLELTEESLIHPVFHVSQLKPSLPDHILGGFARRNVVQASSEEREESHITSSHQVVRASKGGDNMGELVWSSSQVPISQALIRWSGLPLPKEATPWEDWYGLQAKFPVVLSSSKLTGGFFILILFNLIF